MMVGYRDLTINITHEACIYRNQKTAPASDEESDDPVKSWKETCKVLESSVEGLVDDAIARGVSLVLEGVSIRPNSKWMEKFTAAGGTACGVLLTVSDEETHKKLLLKRGFMTGNKAAEQKKLKSFDRVRRIQEEMIQSAKEHGWLLIEQRVDPDPLDVVADELLRVATCTGNVDMEEDFEDCDVPNGMSSVNNAMELVRAELAEDGLLQDKK